MICDDITFYLTILWQHKIALATKYTQKLHGLRGFTLVELLISIAIMGTLSGIAMMSYKGLIIKARTNVAIIELRTIETYIDNYLQENGRLPKTLEDLGMGTLKDPWGNPYRYHALENVPKGMWRKDRFLVPLNTNYDLWSAGPDGQSMAPLTAKQSRDDIVRVNDGGYIGLASQF